METFCINTHLLHKPEHAEISHIISFTVHQVLLAIGHITGLFIFNNKAVFFLLNLGLYQYEHTTRYTC
jgi:hypothetical protein